MADAGRARKIADRIKTLIAANVVSIVKDPDLGFITITDVRVTGDLQHASVFYTVFGDEVQRAKTAALLEKNKGRLRSFVGQQIQIRLTPEPGLLRRRHPRDRRAPRGPAARGQGARRRPWPRPPPGRRTPATPTPTASPSPRTTTTPR